MPIITNAVIIDTTHSPYGHLTPVPITNIRLGEGFWQSRVRLNQKATIPSQYGMLEQTGRLDNFRRVSGEAQKPFQGFMFNDSDVYKWMEAAAWSLAFQPDEQVNDMLENVITVISSAQDKDGYLNTYFSLEKVRLRWMNLAEMHELYCAGHLIQAAIAHHRVVGSYRLLNIALRFADHICRMFGRSQVEGTCGHPEIEMALVELYRTTGEPKYLDQATLFIERRGRSLLGNKEYLLDHAPFRRLERLAGHAVRALYLCCGAADLALESGESELIQTLERLWDHLVNQQMYVTGGVGARYEGEAIGLPYELPNKRAYAESCAAIANLMWNARMLQLEGKASYSDLMEWVLYNAVLPGISQDGTSYFYVNPLENDGSHRRQSWFDCACCPPNIARTMAGLPGYLYGTSEAGIWLHLYAQSSAVIELADDVKVKLEQTTSYPWEGRVKIKLEEITPPRGDSAGGISPGQFSIFLRIPGWLAGQRIGVKVNGKTINHHANPGNYLEINRCWVKGDQVELDFPVEPRFLESHPQVEDNVHRIALAWGPLVYCLEGVDNPGVNLSEARVNPLALVSSEYRPNLFGGTQVLHLPGHISSIDPNWEHQLYRQVLPGKAKSRHPAVDLVAVPYFMWANREPGPMQTWHLQE